MEIIELDGGRTMSEICCAGGRARPGRIMRAALLSAAGVFAAGPALAAVAPSSLMAPVCANGTIFYIDIETGERGRDPGDPPSAQAGCACLRQKSARLPKPGA